MPRYIFICDKCKKETEIQRPVKERNAPLKCECGSMMARIVAKTGAPQFKGSGFYKTDYK